MAEQTKYNEKWNMMNMFYEELHELRMMKRNAFIMQEYTVYYDCLEEIYVSIEELIDDTQNEKKKDSKTQKEKIQEGFIKAKNYMNKNDPRAKIELRKIDIMLNKVQWDNNMIFPKSSKKPRGKEWIDKKYNIKKEDEE